MRRSVLILLAIGLASAAIVGLSSAVARYLCARHLIPPGDDLAWLRREFRLSESELARIRQLHEGYLPRCQELCERIAASKRELQVALAVGNGATPAVEQRLQEVGSLRAQCQAQMQRLTLGFHEQFEEAMSRDQASPHGHD